MNLELCLRTRGRVDVQPTLAGFFLQEVVKKLPWLKLRIVMPKSEYKAYSTKYPWTKKHIRLVPDDFKSGDVFQSIMEDNERYVFCLDDDLDLARRRVLTSPSQVDARANAEDAIDLVKRVRYLLRQGFVHGGFSMRQGNHHSEAAQYLYNMRVYAATFYDSKVIMEEGIRFDAVQARSDFHTTLSLLELGYPNVCDFEFMIGQSRYKGKGETNAPGGCSIYRTPEFLLSQAKLLAKLHSACVSIRYKQVKAKESKGIATKEGVPDVRVGWKKAFNLRVDERSGKFDSTKKTGECV